MTTISVDELVRTSILTYPSIFPNRSTVLHHTLCVIGNGYEWDEDGTVVSQYPSPVWNRETQIAASERQLSNLSERTAMFAREIDMKIIEEANAIVETVDVRVHLREPIDSFYPQSQYALILNIPENVTEDWREACEEMKILAIAAGWKF